MLRIQTVKKCRPKTRPGSNGSVVFVGTSFTVEVDEEYIQDDFNLTGLRSMVPNYDYALDMILDAESDEALTEEQQESIESAAEMLYGLIHARYILTNRGLAGMVEKFNNMDFGRCPRVYCQGQGTLPVGQSDLPRMNTVKLFCPKCEDILLPKVHKTQPNRRGIFRNDVSAFIITDVS